MRILIIGSGLLGLSLASLSGCNSVQHLPEPMITYSSCPVVTQCVLPPAEPVSNGDLDDDNDTILAAWAQCAAQVDTVFKHNQQQPRADP